jgi:hypothetical protein
MHWASVQVESAFAMASRMTPAPGRRRNVAPARGTGSGVKEVASERASRYEAGVRSGGIKSRWIRDYLSIGRSRLAGLVVV